MRTNGVFLSSALSQMKSSFSRSMFKFCLFIYPIVRTIILGEMYRGCSSEDFTSYVVLGTGLMSLWECICFSSASDIDRERYSNTLSLIFIAPSKFQTIMRGKIFGNTVLSLGSLLLTVLFAMLLYQRPFVIMNPLMFSISLLLVIISFSEVSLLIAYLLTLSRKSSVYMNCIDIPLTLICGFAFPVEMLPMWCRSISYILPPTWGVKLLRSCVNSIAITNEYFISAGLLILTTVVISIMGKFAYRLIDKQVKIRATLEVT